MQTRSAQPGRTMTPDKAQGAHRPASDLTDDEVTYASVNDAAEQTGASLSAVRLYIKGGYARTRQGEGPRGTRVEVAVEDVAARLAQTKPADTTPTEKAEAAAVGTAVELADVFVRFDAMAKQLGEVSERAGAAETKAAMLAQQLAEATAERDSLRERLMASIEAKAEPAPVPERPQPVRQEQRRGWFARRRDREEGHGA